MVKKDVNEKAIEINISNICVYVVNKSIRSDELYCANLYTDNSEKSRAVAKWEF